MLGAFGLGVMLAAALGANSGVVAGAQDAPDNRAKPDLVWLDAQKDADKWQEIEAAFADELKPDSAQEVMPYEPMLFKKVRRVAVAGDAALVLIEKGVSEKARSTYFSAYSYDFKTQSKSRIVVKWTMWNWKYYGTVRFEHGTPDVAFTFDSCVNCDATSIVGSFTYQASGNRWNIRMWEHGDQGIYIGSKQESQRGQVLDDCVFAIRDFENRGTDQVLDFCRRREQSSEPPYHVYATTYRADIFEVINGRAMGRSTKNTDERKKLLTTICNADTSNERADDEHVQGELCSQQANLEEEKKHK